MEEKDVYSFVKDNLAFIQKALKIKNIDDFDGEEDIATIFDDEKEKSWSFAFELSSLEDIECSVKSINVNGIALYYVKGEA